MDSGTEIIKTGNTIRIMEKVLLINLKTYEQGTGDKALEIAKIADNLAKNTDVEIILAVQPADLKSVSGSVDIKTFSQHVDPVNYGSKTGWILPESVKQAGAKGTLLNHSERRIDLQTLEKSISRCRKLGLTTVVCADTPETAQKIAGLKPDFIAVEPPELIGGDISVSKAKPEVITESIEKVNSVNPVPVLVGAGVKDREDVKKGMELGAKGILVASGVVKAGNPEEAIKDLLEGFG